MKTFITTLLVLVQSIAPTQNNTQAIENTLCNPNNPLEQRMIAGYNLVIEALDYNNLDIANSRAQYMQNIITPHQQAQAVSEQTEDVLKYITDKILDKLQYHTRHDQKITCICLITKLANMLRLTTTPAYREFAIILYNKAAQKIENLCLNQQHNDRTSYLRYQQALMFYNAMYLARSLANQEAVNFWAAKTLNSLLVYKKLEPELASQVLWLQEDANFHLNLNRYTHPD